MEIGEEILAVPEPPISYNGAQPVGQMSLLPSSVRDDAHLGRYDSNQVRGARMSLDGSLLSERQLDARQMGRQAVEADGE